MKPICPVGPVPVPWVPLRWFLFVVAAVALSACTPFSPKPQLAAIYNRAAQHHGPEQNPVILIPGILGSKLVDPHTDAVVWGAFAGHYANPRTPVGARLLSLPMQPGLPLTHLRDDTEPAGALDRLRVDFLGLPITLNAYANILATLGVGGFRDQQLAVAGAVDYGSDHFTCFQFDYDWRRDNAENAARLHRFILGKRAYVQRQLALRYGVSDYDVKFDLVAHSMGGLLARYYLRYGDASIPPEGQPHPVTWAGARYVARAVLVGTPNAGSVQSLTQLVQGVSFAPFLPSVPPAVVGTMPAVYQLLPQPRHGTLIDAADGSPVRDLYDPSLWRTLGWGLADSDQDPVLEMLLPQVHDPAARRRIALDHLNKCLVLAQRFHQALDTPAPPPPGLQLYLFAGDAEPTASVVSVDRRTGKQWVSDDSPGDGTVPRDSALMDERLGSDWLPHLRSPIAWQQVNFLFADHLGVTKDPVFTDSLLYILLESPHPRKQTPQEPSDSLEPVMTPVIGRDTGVTTSP